MEELSRIFENLTKTTTSSEREKFLETVINLINERYKGDEDDIQKAIVEGTYIQTVLPFLSSASEDSGLAAKGAQLIADLAKTESLRVPLVNLNVVPPLLSLLEASVTSIPLATQVCRALGNICFNNDLGRTAVDEGNGISALLGLLDKYIDSKEEGAAKLRVIACGFILNLTNECELLQERAVEGGALRLLDQCLREHNDDEALVNMALATVISIADSDVGKTKVSATGLLDTLVEVVAHEDTGAPLEPVLELLNSLAESELVKIQLADTALPSHLIRVIQVNIGHCSPDSEQCIKLASSLLLSLLVGDGSMEKLYGGGEGTVFRQCVQWLDAESDELKVVGALAVGNFARSDAHCQQLVDSGIVDSLLSALRSATGSQPDFTLQHAVLSSLRNLAIPASNKAKLLDAGVMQAVIELKETEVMAVAFKLLGVLRMLIDGQETAANNLGQDRDFLTCLVDWCAVDEHAGVKGEATRLLASIIKNSKDSQVMKNIVRTEGIPHLVSMATSEHVVMQNEALVSLNIVAATILGDVAVSFKEANLAGTLTALLKSEETVPELQCNILTLIRNLCSADVLREELIASGLVELIRHLSRNHTNQSVKDAAVSALVLLEEQLSR